MKKFSHVQLSLAGAVLLLGACTGEIQPAEAPSEARVVFEASYSEHGRFTVTEDEAGRLGMSVTGSSSADDPGQVMRKISGSLVATYRALLPGAEAPAALERLDARFTAQHPARAERTGASLAAAAAPAIAATAAVTTPADRFYAAFCAFREESGGFYTVPQKCLYNAWVSNLCVTNDFHDVGPEIFPVNYVKNDSSDASVWGWMNGLGLGTWVGAGQWAMGLPARSAGNVCIGLYTWTPSNGHLDPAAGPAGITYSWGQFED
jgi:hypothetical protein